MQKMVSFRLNRECREITINPAKVLYVCHYDHGSSCIHFGKDCHVRVQGDVAEVSGKIEAALCDGTYDAPTESRKPADALQKAKVN